MNRQDQREALAHQTEGYADADVAQAAIREAVSRLVEAHAVLARVKTELAAANRLVSGPQFVQERISA